MVTSGSTVVPGPIDLIHQHGLVVKCGRDRRADQFQSADAACFVRPGRADAGDAGRVDVDGKFKPVALVKVLEADHERVVSAPMRAGILPACQTQPDADIGRQVLEHGIARVALGIEHHVGKDGGAEIDA